MRKFLTLNLTLIFILILTSGVAFSQSMGFKGVGGRLGFVKPNNIDGAVIFGAHVHLGEIIENLVLMPSIDYFSKSSVDFFSINGNVKYYVPASESINVFGGGGLAIVHTSAPSVNVPGVGKVGGSDTKLGLNILGGADFPVADNLTATAQIIYVTKGEQFKVLGGITYMLGH